MADWSRQRAYVAIMAPSAADERETALIIYPDILPASNITLRTTIRLPINYGDSPLITT